MKRNTAPTTLVIIFFATFVLSLAATMHAKDHNGCSTASAAGDWGFTDTGTVVGVGPFAAVGGFTLDAAGNVVGGKQTTSLNGSIAHLTFAGTYTVNPDCTGTSTVDVFDPSGNKVRTTEFDFVFIDNVREIRMIFTSVVLQPSGTNVPAVITLDAKRLKANGDNEGNED